MKRARPPTATQRTQRVAQEALLEIIRAKLLALGDFGHLHVRRHAGHILIEQPGPPEDPEDRDPVLRLTLLTPGFRFGLSLYRHGGQWERLPVSGVLANVLEDAVRMLGPWLAPDPTY